MHLTAPEGAWHLYGTSILRSTVPVFFSATLDADQHVRSQWLRSVGATRASDLIVGIRALIDDEGRCQRATAARLWQVSTELTAKYLH
jgi:hypothetical protein